MRRHGSVTPIARLVLRVGSLIVPAGRRGEWVEEWKGELVAGHRSLGGRFPQLRLLAGAIADARAIRRYVDAGSWSMAAVGRDGDRPAWRSGTAVLIRDGRHAARSLRRAPGFTVVALLTLSLGVGVTTAVFSAVNSVLLRPLTYRDADAIVIVRQTDIRDGSMRPGVSAANLRDVAAAAQTIEHVSGAGAYGFTLLEDGRAHSLRGWLVAEGYFDALGGHALLGRTFLPEEFRAGHEKVVLLGHRTWLTRFGGRTDVIGRELILDGSAHQVVGVLPPTFKYPSAAEVWAPRPPQPWDEEVRAGAQLDGVARLAPGATPARAEAELERIAARLAAAHPSTNTNTGFRIVPFREHLFGPVQQPLLLMLGAVGLVLLITAANLAGLQLARGSARSREYALRRALGAGTAGIVRQVGVEGLLLAAAGCIGGLVVAQLGVGLIRVLAPDHLPRIDELSIDGVVLVFALAISVVCALLAAVTPALRASRMDALSAALADGSRTATAGRAAHRLRDRLVIGEIALALVLSVGAGLLLRSYQRILANEAGFDPEHRLAVQVFAYDESDEPDLPFLRRALEEIISLPGVVAAGLTTAVPLADNESVWSMHGTARFTIDGTTPFGDEREARIMAVDSGYPPAMGIDVTAGRAFTARDDADSPPVLMANEAFVRRYLPGRDPVGTRITLAGTAAVSREIVGVLSDVRAAGLESEPTPELYLPYFQSPVTGGVTLVIRTEPDPGSMTAVVQEAVWSIKPAQSIWAARPLPRLLEDWSRERRFITALLLAFAILAVILAGIGIYGLLSFTVTQRMNEMGVRRALGADGADILRVVLRSGLTLALSGAAIGAAAAALLSRLLRGLLFGVQPLDPLTFAATTGFVVGVALLAALQPAWRAARIEPLVALRGR